MQKSILYVLISFSSVTFVILFGTLTAYKTNIIPAREKEYQKEHLQVIEQAQKQEDRIKELQAELDLALEKQREAEELLKGRLQEEEQLALEKARLEQEARLRAQQEAAAAEQARIIAEEKKQSSKTSSAS